MSVIWQERFPPCALPAPSPFPHPRAESEAERGEEGRELKRSVRALLPEGKALRLAADTGWIRNLSIERAELHLSHLEPWVLSTLSLCHEEQQGGLELRLLTVSYHSPDPPKDPKGQGTRTM